MKRRCDCIAGQSAAEWIGFTEVYPMANTECMPRSARLFLALGCVAALLAVALGPSAPTH